MILNELPIIDALQIISTYIQENQKRHKNNKTVCGNRSKPINKSKKIFEDIENT
jgi:hypothetical protein